MELCYIYLHYPRVSTDGVHFLLLIFHLYYYFFPSSFHDCIPVLRHISVYSPVFLHFILALSLFFVYLKFLLPSVRIKLKLEDI